MPFPELVRKVRWSLQGRGLARTVQALPEALRRRWREEPVRVHPFDERYGTETGGVIGGGALGAGHRHDVHITAYVGVAPSRLRGALDRWEATLAGQRLEEFWFVDLGCGKGRALLLASERPFRGVLGVELHAGLVEVARRNAAAWATAGRARTTIEVWQGDAAEVTYPEGPCLLFLYNPFGVPVVRAVLDGLHRSVAATGARVDLLFQNEGPEMPMRGDPGLEPVWRLSLPLEGEDLAAEPVGAPEDVTALYRFRGAGIV